jgi:hypothetical protein
LLDCGAGQQGDFCPGGWAISGTLSKKMKLAIESSKNATGERTTVFWNECVTGGAAPPEAGGAARLLSD